MRSGTLVQGEYVYTNTLWLAKGANADGLERDDYFANFAPDDPGQMTGDIRRALTYEFFGMGRSVTNGDYELPADTAGWPDGLGEIAELRLAADADEVFVRIRWHSYRPGRQIATLAFAAPGSTTKRAWPANARLDSPYDVALTLGLQGELTDAGGATTAVPTRHGDHITEARIPRAALPAGPWSLTGGSGLADPADRNRYWTVPAGSAAANTPGAGGANSPTNVWGLLFANDTPWSFDELRQSRLLTAADATGAAATLDPADLTARRTKRAALAHGDIGRIHRSRYDGGDGIQRSAGVAEHPPVPTGAPIGADFNVTYTRTGRLQDYAMRVPPAYDGRRAWPLIVYLHGFGGNPEEPFRLPLGLVDEAATRGYLFASLQGRGDLFYRPGIGELDVLEVLAEVRRLYRVDTDRIYLMGHSMGGYGTDNIAARHPDLFAAVAPAQGTDSQVYAGNLRHVPWFKMTSEEDLDAQGAAATAHYERLSALGYDATLINYKRKIHEYSSIYDTLPRLFAHFAAHRRVARPAVVTWVRPPTSEDHPELGQVHDGAYWLHGVDAGTVTVESGGIPHRSTDPARAVRTVTDPSDEGGPTGRTDARLATTRPQPGALSQVANTLSIKARGTKRLEVSLPGAQLHVESDLRIRTDTDQPLTMHLIAAPLEPAPPSHGWATYWVFVDDREIGPLARRGNLFTLRSPAGRHVITLRVVRVTPGPTRPGSLPATGLPVTWPAFALLATATAVLGRRQSGSRRRPR